jgi:hypothetical protein
MILAQHIFTCLQSLPESGKLDCEHSLWKVTESYFTREGTSNEWFPMIDEAVTLIYKICIDPDLLLSRIIKKMTRNTFNSENSPEQKKNDSFNIAKLIFLVGNVAMKQVNSLDIIEFHKKQLLTKDRRSLDDELRNIGYSLEEEITDRMNLPPYCKIYLP